MLIPVTIYITSFLVMWLFVHYYRKESNAIDLPFTIVPGLNSTMALIAIGYMLSEVNWEIVSNKFFNVKQ